MVPVLEVTQSKDISASDFEFPVEELHRSSVLPYLDEEEKREQKQKNAYLEYRDYLGSVFATLSYQSEEYGVKLGVTPDELVDELTFWTVDDFVIPDFFHNYEGGVVLQWRTNGVNLRIERLAGEPVYHVATWSDTVEPKKALKVDAQYFLTKILPEVYGYIVKNSKKSTLDWEGKANGDSASPA